MVDLVEQVFEYFDDGFVVMTTVVRTVAIYITFRPVRYLYVLDDVCPPRHERVAEQVVEAGNLVLWDVRSVVDDEEDRMGYLVLCDVFQFRYTALVGFEDPVSGAACSNPDVYPVDKGVGKVL